MCDQKTVCFNFQDTILKTLNRTNNVNWTPIGQLAYFMTSRLLKASHIKREVKKKIEAAKRYVSALLLYRMHIHSLRYEYEWNETEKHKCCKKISVYVQFRVLQQTNVTTDISLGNDILWSKMNHACEIII